MQVPPFAQPDPKHGEAMLCYVMLYVIKLYDIFNFINLKYNTSIFLITWDSYLINIPTQSLYLLAQNMIVIMGILILTYWNNNNTVAMHIRPFLYTVPKHIRTILYTAANHY